jgi:hypothetical protein
MVVCATPFLAWCFTAIASAEASPDQERKAASAAANTQMTLFTGSTPSIEISNTNRARDQPYNQPFRRWRDARRGRGRAFKGRSAEKHTHGGRGRSLDRAKAPGETGNQPISVRPWPTKLPDRLIMLRQCNIRDAIMCSYLNAAMEVSSIDLDISMGGSPPCRRPVSPRWAKYGY